MCCQEAFLPSRLPFPQPERQASPRLRLSWGHVAGEGSAGHGVGGERASQRAVCVLHCVSPGACPPGRAQQGVQVQGDHSLAQAPSRGRSHASTTCRMENLKSRVSRAPTGRGRGARAVNSGMAGCLASECGRRRGRGRRSREERGAVGERAGWQRVGARVGCAGREGREASGGRRCVCVPGATGRGRAVWEVGGRRCWRSWPGWRCRRCRRCRRLVCRRRASGECGRRRGGVEGESVSGAWWVWVAESRGGGRAWLMGGVSLRLTSSWVRFE